MSAPPELALFLGRFHPLVVHLPVALILLLAVLELMSRFPRFRHANANAGIILAITVVAAVLSAGFGWMLSLGGGYQDQLLGWHKWTGIALASLCVLAGLAYRLDLRKPYRICLFCGVLVLLFTAHFGGSLTHGSDYLVRYAPGPLRQWLAKPSSPVLESTTSSPNDLQLFAAVVQPVFQQNCVSCHGPEKSKAGLRLDSLAGILQGGESGPGVVPGKPAESIVLKRMRLPLSDEDHMPPEGKPQPTAAEVGLIEWWIRAGAVSSLNPQFSLNFQAPPGVARILQEKLGWAAPARTVLPPKAPEQVLPVAATLAQDLKVALSQIAAGEPWLQCNASLAGTNFGNAELARLSAVGPNLRWLDLAGTGITDQGLDVLTQMPNLMRLHLERTAISDSALHHVSGLPQLEYLNLHHTAITDAGLQMLQPLTNLRKLYLWETAVSPEAAQAYVETRTDNEQIEKWREDIERLNASIRQAHILVDTGHKARTATATNSPAFNVACPVSAKRVDAARTLLYDGKRIAFCCDDCKAKFQQDPQVYLSKLEAPIAKESEAKTRK